MAKKEKKKKASMPKYINVNGAFYKRMSKQEISKIVSEYYTLSAAPNINHPIMDPYASVAKGCFQSMGDYKYARGYGDDVASIASIPLEDYVEERERERCKIAEDVAGYAYGFATPLHPDATSTYDMSDAQVIPVEGVATNTELTEEEIHMLTAPTVPHEQYHK